MLLHHSEVQWSVQVRFCLTNGKITKWKELQYILSKKGHLSYQKKYRKYLTLLAFLTITNPITQKASSHTFQSLKVDFWI